MKTKSFATIIINGKRWFQRTYGNTYHSVSITIKHARKPDITLESGIRYGYGSQYVQTACDLLIKEGYFKDWNDFNACMRNNMNKFYITVSDVSRERDLK